MATRALRNHKGRDTLTEEQTRRLLDAYKILNALEHELEQQARIDLRNVR